MTRMKRIYACNNRTEVPVALLSFYFPSLYKSINLVLEDRNMICKYIVFLYNAIKYNINLTYSIVQGTPSQNISKNCILFKICIRYIKLCFKIVGRMSKLTKNMKITIDCPKD